jgi:hypothetical protein
MSIAHSHGYFWCDQGFGTVTVIYQNKIIAQALIFGKGDFHGQ